MTGKIKTVKKPRAGAKTTPMMIWLRQYTFADIYGVELTVDGRRETRPSCLKQTYLFKRNSRRWIRRMANYDYRDHFDRKSTTYYMGEPNSEHTLAMLDIDVGKKAGLGTTEGAWAFARHLQKFWPSLYLEPSTGGKGVHGYLVVCKLGHDAAKVNEFLKRLQDWLRNEAAATNADIELVEIKGTLPVITYDNKQITAIKYGMFAKVPRAEDRFEELRNTTVLDINLPLPRNSGNVLPVAKAAKAKPSICGSVSGRNISEEELALIPEYEACYESLKLNLRHERYRIDAHDFAVFCVLMRFFRENGNADDSLPVRRVQRFWDALYTCGDVRRPFNHHRFKVLRDYLSEHGHIEWIDNRYECPEGDKKGIACKWRLTDHFYNLLELVGEQGKASFVVSEEFQKDTGVHRTPVKCLIRAERERKWWSNALERLENFEYYSLAA